MALLFAVGVAVGLSDDHDGTACLAGLVSWLVITTVLSESTVTTLMPSIADDEVKLIAFQKIQNAFIGILAGVIGSSCYNRFKGQTLPDFLAFFSGKRFVAIATAGVSLAACVILLFVWPLIFQGFVIFGEWIVNLGAVGAGIYAFFNRLLIPFGLHHALNNVFWFDTIGLGDLTHFWAGDVTGSNGVTWSLGMYMSGFFPCMMFGIPGAALAIYRNAKPAKKKMTASLMISSALCAFICGVTEPFEFAFMFACFPLYVVYAALYGIFTIITTLSGFRAGFSFSAGLTDLIFSSSLPAAAKTWLIIPLGIAAFVVFYLVFNFCIRKFNLKTPGREDDEDAAATASAAVSAASSDDSKYAATAKAVLAAIGGKENIDSLTFCATRLRFTVKDETKVDAKAVKAAAPLGMIKPGKNSVQVIIGTQVQHVYDEMKKLM